MSYARIYKSAMLEKVTGINAVTLRSWRRKGQLKPLGFETTGEMNRYSFIDMCVFVVAVELIQAHIEMPLALLTAIEMHDDIRNIITENRNDGPVTIVGQDADAETFSHWTGFAVLRKSKMTEHYHSAVARTADEVALSLVLQDTNVALMVNLGKICQKVAINLIYVESAEA